MELFVTIVTGFHLLTIATESSIVDIAGALDPSLRELSFFIVKN